MDSRRKILKLAAAVFLTIALVVLGTLIGWRLSNDLKRDTAIGQVTVEVQPSLGGEVDAFIPIADWGIRADAFDAPLKLRAELVSIDRNALIAAAEGDRTVLDKTRADLRSAARDGVVRYAIWGVAVSLVLLLVASLIWRSLRPRWLLMVLGAFVLVVIYGGSALRVQSTFDTTAFESPTYFAKGNEIGRILDLATEVRVRSDYGDEFTNIVRSISAVLATGREPHAPGSEVYVGSDLHANALVIDPIAELVGGNPLLLAGDFGQRGNQAEARLLAPRVAALGSEVVATSGNHDSVGLMNELVAEGVTVLGRKGTLAEGGAFEPPPVIKVDGLKVAGSQDPLEYGGSKPSGVDRPVTADGLDDPERAIKAWRTQLFKWFTGLPDPPDVVMIHQNGLAQWLAGALRHEGYRRPLTIVTGHDHKQHVDRYGDIFVVDAGTIGAGGIFGAGEDSVGIARLGFTGRSTLESVDLIAVEPISGAARARRIVTQAMCPVEKRCRIEPDATEDDLPAD